MCPFLQKKWVIMSDFNKKILWICIKTLQFADFQTSFVRNHEYNIKRKSNPKLIALSFSQD